MLNHWHARERREETQQFFASIKACKNIEYVELADYNGYLLDNYKKIC